MVIGIGNKFAQKLVMNYKITSISELKKAHKAGEIELSDQILLGLKYYGVVQGDIPRKEIISMEKYLRTEAHKLSPELEIIICGSYRRGNKTSGDIDVLLYHTDIKTSKQIKKPSYLELLVDTLTDDEFVIDHLTDKNYRIKYMGFCKWKKNFVRRIDIMYIPMISYYTALVHFTGSGETNRKMRDLAKELGYRLSEDGLFKINNDKKIRIQIKSEKDVFKKLGLEYIPPEDR